MSDFDPIKQCFYVKCFDYLSNKTFISQESYSTYVDAYNAIPSLVPPSACCGFSIITMPELEFENLEFLNANFEK